MPPRRWYHEVDPDWLAERRRVLTATEISGLLPAWKRWRKAGGDEGNLPPEFSALWCQKNTEGFDDPTSVGAAARGHIMEPYAIEDWNAQRQPAYEHWDDCVVVRDGVGFSPDAMTVPQQGGCVLVVSNDGESMRDPDTGLEVPAPARIMEVKCYEPANHMKALCAGKSGHKEAMQVAVAFHVLPKLEGATVLWYCPNAPFPMHCEEYSRDDVSELADAVGEIARLYSLTERYWQDRLLGDPDILESFHTEDEVYSDFAAYMNAELR